jgi:hypothetical protein
MTATGSSKNGCVCNIPECLEAVCKLFYLNVPSRLDMETVIENIASKCPTEEFSYRWCKLCQLRLFITRGRAQHLVVKGR